MLAANNDLSAVTFNAPRVLHLLNPLQILKALNGGYDNQIINYSDFHRSTRRAGNLHLKGRANVPKECAKSGTIRKNFAHYFRIRLK
ncbi:hypothetical protein GsuE55_07140 [Geobacillus subterraneus]|uniref:Uncharacterized protein n=2 Tax=Geobacillus TaxID=129337 RepID=A0A679FVY5_9BACL|nr:hypothetical protein GsuE55_07140 [Geobacillus subterraneus]